MVLEISKCYSPYGFHLISATLHEGIGHHRGIQLVTFLSDQLTQVFKHFVTL